MYYLQIKHIVSGWGGGTCYRLIVYSPKIISCLAGGREKQWVIGLHADIYFPDLKNIEHPSMFFSPGLLYLRLETRAQWKKTLKNIGRSNVEFQFVVGAIRGINANAGHG